MCNCPLRRTVLLLCQRPDAAWLMLYFQVGGAVQLLRLLTAQELLAPGPTGLASASYSQLAAVIDTR